MCLKAHLDFFFSERRKMFFIEIQANTIFVGTKNPCCLPSSILLLGFGREEGEGEEFPKEEEISFT